MTGTLKAPKAASRRAFPAELKVLASGVVPAADLHMHTTWTDGAASVAEMHARAVAEGLTAILFSEHARKTSGDWFPAFAAEVRALPQGQCRALVGVECKVDDFDGAVDAVPEILDLCDLVMASVHRFPGEQGQIKGTTGGLDPAQAVEMELRLSLAAMDNPAVDILGHPLGMSLSRFKTVPPWECFAALIDKAARTGVAFEINARYHPDPWRLVRACLEAGAPISLGSNAHSLDEVGQIKRVLESKAS